MTIKPPDGKPNPADPLSNPPTVPEVTPSDLPIPAANEPPPDDPSGALMPGRSSTQPDHPLGPHSAIERTRSP